MVENKDFSIIETILVVAVVALLGFVGWRVWEAREDKGNTDQNTRQNQANEQKSEELSPDGYLHIKELGVKIKLTEGIEDAVYDYKPDMSLVFLSSMSLISQSKGACDPKEEAALGALLATSTENKQNGLFLTSANKKFIYYSPSPQSCTADSLWQSNLSKSMSDAVKTIELDQ